MPTLKAGTLIKRDACGLCRPAGRRQAGFTLLELVVIITILGVTALMVFPKLSAFGVHSGKSTTRHLSRLIQHLAQEALATKQYYRLYYDLEAEAYSVKILQGREFVPVSDGLISGRSLPKGVVFKDVVTYRHGKVEDGEAYTEFFPLGVEKTTIHLQEGENDWTLIVNGLTGRVKVYDRYLEKTERATL